MGARLMFGLAAFLALRRAPLDFYVEQQRRQGDYARVRLGPYRLWLLFHPQAVEALLTGRTGDFVRFERAMRVLSQWNGESLLILEGERWRMRRRNVLPAFARRRMGRYAACSASHATALCDDWTSRCDQSGGLVVDTDAEMARLSLAIALDAMFGAQADASRDEIATAVAIFSDVAYSETSGLWRTPRWSPFGRGPRKRWAMEVVDRAVRGMIAERLRSGADDRGDLLSTLLQGETESARDDAVTLLIAGHETSGAALCWLACMLSQSLTALTAAQSEVDRVLEGRTPTLDDFERLVCLRAALDETLRLYPPAYGLFPRRAVCRTKIGDATIERGDLALLVPYVTHRDARWFEAPDAFRPERFLSPPTWPTYAYFPFGAGPRSCIGQQFGVVEITIAMATLLQRFTPVAVDAPLRPEAKFSLQPKGGLMQRWVLRMR